MHLNIQLKAVESVEKIYLESEISYQINRGNKSTLKYRTNSESEVRIVKHDKVRLLFHLKFMNLFTQDYVYKIKKILNIILTINKYFNMRFLFFGMRLKILVL